MKCPECQKEEMVIIGTEKFKDNRIDGRTNWQVMNNVTYMIYTVWYCHKCDIISLKEPKLIFG